MSQLALIPDSSDTRYTIRHKRTGLWWSGVVWTDNGRLAIGLHGRDVLNRELSLLIAIGEIDSREDVVIV